MRTVPLTARHLVKLAAFQQRQEGVQAEINAYLSAIAEAHEPAPSERAQFTVRDGQLVITEPEG